MWKATKTKQAWHGMINRCYNPKSKSYPRYGGRGIGVAERWHTYANFLEDLGEIPEGLTLDRIDNDGDYEPGNTRWATMKEQQRNKSNNRRIEIGGQKETIAYWAETTGVRPSTIGKRLKRGATPKEAIEPGDRTKRNVTAYGRTQSVTEWSEETGVRDSTIIRRLEKGMSPEEAIKTIDNRERKYITFNGKTQTQTAWATEIGIAASTISKRLSKGYSPEEIMSSESFRGKKR